MSNNEVFKIYSSDFLGFVKIYCFYFMNGFYP